MISDREQRLLRIAQAKMDQAMIDRALDRLEAEIRDKDALGHGSDPKGAGYFHDMLDKRAKRRKRKKHSLQKHGEEIGRLKAQIAHAKEHHEAKQHHAAEHHAQKLHELEKVHEAAKSHHEALKQKLAESSARIAALKAQLK